MYGIPGNRFGTMIKVSAGDFVHLVKEAQVANKPSRTFFLGGDKRINLTWDGMFLVDTTSGEVVDEQRFEEVQVTTPILS